MLAWTKISSRVSNAIGDECVDRGRREDMIRKYPAAVERDIKIYMKLIDIRQLEEHGPVIGNPLQMAGEPEKKERKPSGKRSKKDNSD